MSWGPQGGRQGPQGDLRGAQSTISTPLWDISLMWVRSCSSVVADRGAMMHATGEGGRGLRHDVSQATL